MEIVDFVYKTFRYFFSFGIFHIILEFMTLENQQLQAFFAAAVAC